MNTEETREVIRNHPNADTDMLLEAQDLLAKELQKPYKKRNNELIEELTDLIYRLTSSDDIESVAANGIEKLHKQRDAKHAARPRKRWIRLAIVSTACLLALICANVWSVQARDLNIFQTVYHIFDGGVDIYFGKQDNNEEEIILTVSEDDPYGIRTKCEEYGFSPLTPSYIPAEFKLTDMGPEILSAFTEVYFTYTKGREIVQFEYKYFPDIAGLYEGKFGIASDQHNFSEVIIEGYPIFISWEDQQFSAVFLDDDRQILYTMMCINIDYAEAMKILSSLFEQ